MFNVNQPYPKFSTTTIPISGYHATRRLFMIVGVLDLRSSSSARTTGSQTPDRRTQSRIIRCVLHTNHILHAKSCYYILSGSQIIDRDHGSSVVWYTPIMYSSQRLSIPSSPDSRSSIAIADPLLCAKHQLDN